MSRSFGPGCSRPAIASRASSRMRSSHVFKEAGRNHSAAIFLTIVCSGGSRYVTVSRIRRLLLDLHDIGVLGDEPERVVALDVDLRQRRVLAEPLVRHEKRLVFTMPFGQHHMAGDVVRDADARSRLGDAHARLPAW